MKQTNRSGRTGLLIITGIVSAIVIAALFYLADYFNSTDTTSVVEEVPAPIIGSTSGPAEMPNAGADSENKDPVVVDPAAIAPGDSVQVAVSDNSEPPLYNDARSNALIMDLLVVGEQLIVIEPNGDYEAYPVQNDDGQWIRVRAGDGLAGWVHAEKLVMSE